MRFEKMVSRGRGILALTMFIALMSAPALASELDGVRFDDQKMIKGRTVVLNGLGCRDEVLHNVKVYVAGLYLESKSGNPRRILRNKTFKHLELKFISKVRQYSINNAWRDGFKRQAGEDLPKFSKQIDRLMNWTTSVGSGDSYSFTYIPQKGLEVRVKGELKGTIEGDEFAQLFFSIWLSDEPVNMRMKAGLLGRNS